jgi:hypothetical protein
MKSNARAQKNLESWGSVFVQLSCEIEGHPLGGGMLKLEPREAGQIVLPLPVTLKKIGSSLLEEAIDTMRHWRHHVVNA